MTDNQFASRREMREAERTGPTDGSAKNIQATEAVPTGKAASQISTTGVTNPYAPKNLPSPTQAVPAVPVVQSISPTLPIIPVQQIAYEPVMAEAEEVITSQFPIFSVSPNLSLEPQTASIIIDNFQPLENSAIVISETGETLKTGSISLPNLSTNTGEISTIRDAAQVDEAAAQDSVMGYVGTIAPIRASGVVNSSGKIGMMPSKRARGSGASFTALAIAIISISIGGLVLGAFMLGILK